MLKQIRTLLVSSLLLTPLSAIAGSGQLTFIHIGDLHGHLIPRPNMREDAPDHGLMVGGVAYVYDQVKKIRARKPNNLLVNTGDTIQGGAEALYTRGEAMVDILNDFGIDAFAPGNWDFIYGTESFRELFAGIDGQPPLANWNALAANLYYSTLYEFPETIYAKMAGTRVIKPWLIHEVGGLRVGFIGLTADRGPQAVSNRVTEGFYLTPGEQELANAVPLLRNEEKVDLVVLISERGLAANLELVETIPGVDIVLSSDMHEETHQVMVAKSGTLLIEKGKLASWDFTAHRINTRDNQPDPAIAAKVKKIRSTFVKGSDFVPHVNPMNASILRTPIDTVIGHTKVALHRSNFSDAKEMPAVMEGSSHNFLADAFRGACESDIGMIRGFRYGTHIAPGPIKLEDIYHYIPIGPQVACGLISGDDLRLMIQRGLQGSLTQWVGGWGGGWVIAFAGITYDVDPYQEFGLRSSNIRVNGELLDPAKYYQVGGYWYLDDPGKINRTRALEIKVLKSPDGGIVDATAVAAYYLRTLPDNTTDPEPNRITLLKPLPGPIGPNREIQPLAGVIRPEYLAQIKHRSQERHISSKQLIYRSTALSVSNQTIAAQSQNNL
jgi:2',3'-cyclic-nucleotide 2'-phosphodiesterase (5'-nucleotidase family)